jgi:hypothetical protein
MITEVVKINDLPYDSEFKNALGELEHRIIEDYGKFNKRGDPSGIKLKVREDAFEEFKNELGYIPGRKYLKVVTKKSLWGFINIKNIKFKEGDILKGAGYNAPALNKARGNIFNDNYEIAWTGPKYLPGSTGMASYEMQEGTA